VTTLATKKSLLVVVRQPPYSSSLARTSLEVALSSASFEQEIGLLFMGDGVLQLLPEQDSTAIGARNMAKLIASFPLYDLNALFADEAALQRYGFADKHQFPASLQRLDNNAMRLLFDQYDHILGF
jgi:tRNA 2-thiouridine synthesizing protein C